MWDTTHINVLNLELQFSTTADKLITGNSGIHFQNLFTFNQRPLR